MFLLFFFFFNSSLFTILSLYPRQNITQCYHLHKMIIIGVCTLWPFLWQVLPLSGLNSSVLLLLKCSEPPPAPGPSRKPSFLAWIASLRRRQREVARSGWAMQALGLLNQASNSVQCERLFSPCFSIAPFFFFYLCMAYIIFCFFF